MEQAAKMAGILDDRSAGQTILTFAPEPEAAALSTLTEPGRKTKAGEVYLVCDAGGGTVVSTQKGAATLDVRLRTILGLDYLQNPLCQPHFVG
ncbi:hypothetical protein E5D57_003563 [Metarhizium anisopliae]|nr:hypothetical protein E5D57_003563 [Metarhizium anisopliae]